MASLSKWVWKSMWRSASLPLRFPSSGFEVINDPKALDEERFKGFMDGHYYPVNIGDVYSSRYQVVGKLGFGTTSTVWLARDLQAHQHVALKVYKRGLVKQEEFKTYQALKQADASHPGYHHVRRALDSFTIPRSGGDHECLVQEPTWDSFTYLLYRLRVSRFPEALLKEAFTQVLLALDFLHTECKLVHTDISGYNILIGIADKSILEDFTKAEMKHPSPRKFVGNRTVYSSRLFGVPKTYGGALLSDFGSAVRGDQARNHFAQPDFYRSPEVMLQADWSYPADIWNVGLVIWKFFEGENLFCETDPDSEGYSIGAHLAELIGMLGPPPLDLLKRGKRSHDFFTEDGRWKADIKVSDHSLGRSEKLLEGENKEMFLNFIRGMLQWRPEDRKTAKELLQDPWLMDQ